MSNSTKFKLKILDSDTRSIHLSKTNNNFPIISNNKSNDGTSNSMLTNRTSLTSNPHRRTSIRPNFPIVVDARRSKCFSTLPRQRRCSLDVLFALLRNSQCLQPGWMDDES